MVKFVQVLVTYVKNLLTSFLVSVKGHWRMSHYFAQEMFSKVLVSPTLPSPYNTLKVSIVSDHLEPLEVELMVKIQRWDELENHYRGHP